MKRSRVLLALLALFAPALASAHEVYVLSPGQISQAVDTPRFAMLPVIWQNLHAFEFWAFIGILAVFCVFFMSIIRKFERWLHPLFVKMRPHAQAVARVTIGVSFLAVAYYQASYGPELPLASTYGHWTPFVTLILVVIGVLIIVNLYARIAALVALVMYAIAWYFHGWYMLTYVNYLGEIVALLALIPKKYEFAVIRVCFGVSLIVASAYAKIIHNNLGLDTVNKYHLDKLLGFEPHFLVLGAAIVEILIGTFIIFGFEIRFTSLFFEFWLILSLCFFGEVVWPHLILIGIPIALFMYGYDNYSLEGHFLSKKKYEPVL